MADSLKLHRELFAAGLPVVSVDEYGGYVLDDTATAQDYLDADAIVAAHDPVDYELQDAEAARAELYGTIVSAIADYDVIEANWDTLDAAQLNDVLRRNTRALRHILAYLRRDLRRPIIEDE
jgi:hypothetical protein